MKNNKRSNFMNVFGIMILSLGVAIACSTTGEDDKKIVEEDEQIIDEIEILEEILLDQFKTNYVGTYTAEPTATLEFHGKQMIFNNNGLVYASINADDDLYFDIALNGDPGAATILRLFFREDDVDFEPYTQEVIAQTTTNVFIQNPVMYTTGGTIEGGDIVELIINPDTGALIFDGVKIATKN